MSLGALFPLLDMTAGRCAGVYSKGYVVTGCFDDVTVEQWVRHGDIVIVRANVVAVGSSSMTVSMILYREVLRKRKRRQQVAIRYGLLPNPCLSMLSVHNGFMQRILTS